MVVICSAILSAKVGTNLADGGGSSVGIVRVRTKATEFSLVSAILINKTKHN